MNENTSEIMFDFFLVVILVASVLLVRRVSASGQWPKSPGATAPWRTKSSKKQGSHLGALMLVEPPKKGATYNQQIQ